MDPSPTTRWRPWLRGWDEGSNELGVEPGHRVLIALPDGAEYVASLFGILAIGAVAVMINPELRPDHLAAILDSGSRPGGSGGVGPPSRPWPPPATLSSAPTRPLVIDPGAHRTGSMRS